MARQELQCRERFPPRVEANTNTTNMLLEPTAISEGGGKNNAGVRGEECTGEEAIKLDFP